MATLTPMAKSWSQRMNETPRAVTIPEAAELLGRSVPDVERAAREVEPYWHADGFPKWPLRELARVLADCGGVRRPW